MIISKKEPSVKKSVRIPFSCSVIIDEISEENGMTYTETMVQLIKLGIESLNQMEREETQL